MMCFRATTAVLLSVLLSVLASAEASAQVVTVTVPAGVSFAVTNVAATTTATPAPFNVSFSGAIGFLLGQRLRISVRAESGSFSTAQGTAIPATAVSWLATGATRGTGSNGTLSSVSYNEVYRSEANPSSGSVSLTWRLAPLNPTGLRAGSQTLTVRWRFEAL